MAASSRKLAVALATRLNAVVPKPLSVRAVGTEVHVYNGTRFEGSSPASEIVDDDDGRSLAEKADWASSAVVNGIQDVVARTLTEQWPLLPGAEMAIAHARTDGEHIYIWFGDLEAPALVLPPIDISELENGD